MGEARLDEHWAHTASILALIANVNRDPKKTGPFKPSDFLPRRQSSSQMTTEKADISVLKHVFLKQPAAVGEHVNTNTKESSK